MIPFFSLTILSDYPPKFTPFRTIPPKNLRRCDLIVGRFPRTKPPAYGPPSSGIPVPPSSRDAQGNPPASSNDPPRPTESYPHPPSSVPPMRKKPDICTPFRPTVWEVAHELYYWRGPKVDISVKSRNFPQSWSLEHANANTSNQNRLRIATACWPI